MKFFHIIQVSESALRARLKNREALERALGAAVVDLCVGRPRLRGPTENVVEHRPSLGDQRIVRYVEEFADRDLAFFAAVDGQLRSTTELSSHLLQEGIRLFEVYKKYAADEDGPHP